MCVDIFSQFFLIGTRKVFPYSQTGNIFCLGDDVKKKKVLDYDFYDILGYFRDRFP
jgi:hypothetical protein